MGFQGQVPLALENVPLRAVLTGAPTAEQRKRVLSSCEVRRAQVSEWLDWYTVHNKYVRSAAKSGENLASLPERDTRPAAIVTCDWKNAGTELGCGAEAGVGTAEEEHEESSHDILATAAIAPAPVSPKDILTSIATKVAHMAHSQPALDGAPPAGPAGPASPDAPAGVSFHDLRRRRMSRVGLNSTAARLGQGFPGSSVHRAISVWARRSR